MGSSLYARLEGENAEEALTERIRETFNLAPIFARTYLEEMRRLFAEHYAGAGAGAGGAAADEGAAADGGGAGAGSASDPGGSGAAPVLERKHDQAGHRGAEGGRVRGADPGGDPGHRAR